MSAKYHNRKTQVLNDVYRKEGNDLLSQADFEGAIRKYSEALHLYSRDLEALVNRSKCYMKTKNVRKAIDDVETALHLNNLYKEALLQKANILYDTQDYDLSFIYYHRGHKVYPRNKGFIEGMKKTEYEISKAKKGKGKKQKLTPAGDLTYLIHKVPDPKPFKFQHVQDRKVKHLPSATFNTRPLCQLIRIHKTPSIGLMKANSFPDLNDISDDEELQDKRPESRLVKSTIGEFYDDKKYLEKLASHRSPRPTNKNQKAPKTKIEKIEEQNEEAEEKKNEEVSIDQNKETPSDMAPKNPEIADEKTDRVKKEEQTDEGNEKTAEGNENAKVSIDETPREQGKNTQTTKLGDEARVWGAPLEAIANDGLHFLFDRVSYWDRLGPLPPPPPYKKTKAKKQWSSTTSLNTTFSTASTVAHSTSSKVTAHSSYYYVEKKRAPTYRRRNSKEEIKIDPGKLHFNFKSIETDRRESRHMTKIPEENGSSYNPSPSAYGDTPQGQTVTDYIRKEIERISEGYKLGWIQETIGSCESCLRLLEKYPDEEIPEKHELIAILHSYRGNCAVQNRQFDEALKNHNVDLSIGHKIDSRCCRFRALGNIGRVYMLQGKHQKALETLTMKAPLCKTAKESASLFHEIGNCFLLLSHFQYAKDSAKKSLQCAEECGEKRLQLQACVLIGLADVNMKKYKDAHKSFEEALTHAEALGDKKAQEAMEQALIDVNKKIAHKLKTKAIHNRTNELNQQVFVEPV